MIDITNTIYTIVRNAVKTSYPTMECSQTAQNSFKTLPALCFQEISNIVYQPTMDECGENHASVSFQIDVYDTDKERCKAIASIADTYMGNNNFVRSFGQFIPNSDREINRFTLRYNGIVAKGVTTGTTTDYVVYRR